MFLDILTCVSVIDNPWESFSGRTRSQKIRWLMFVDIRRPQGDFPRRMSDVGSARTSVSEHGAERLADDRDVCWVVMLEANRPGCESVAH